MQDRPETARKVPHPPLAGGQCCRAEGASRTIDGARIDLHVNVIGSRWPTPVNAANDNRCGEWADITTVKENSAPAGRCWDSVSAPPSLFRDP